MHCYDVGVSFDWVMGLGQASEQAYEAEVDGV